MSELSVWAGRMKPSQELYQLKEADATSGLYMMKERIGDGVPSYGYLSPIYYVWLNDKCVLATMNYREAYECYRRRIYED